MEYKSFNATLKPSKLLYYLKSAYQLSNSLKPRGLVSYMAKASMKRKDAVIHLPDFGVKYKVKTNLDILTLKEVVIDSDYENESVYIDGNDRIIADIGAGFGDFSIFQAKQHPRAKIFAFEPDPSYASLMRENMRLNGCTSKISVLEKPIMKLEDIFRYAKSPRIDFLKMDCEGAEYSIFDAAGIKFLNRIGKIAMEYHDCGQNHHRILTRRFRRAGFELTEKTNRGEANLGFIYAKRKDKS